MSDHGGGGAGARAHGATALAPMAADAIQPALVGLGSAVPKLCRMQNDVAAEMAEAWALNAAERRRFDRIVANARIEQRYAVAPIEDVFHATTQQRMELFEQHAPGLAARAAQRAMDDGHVSAAQITDVVVVSCTGFSAPGIDVQLARDLGLPRTVRRTMIGFMGCFGAIIGLRTAANIATADPRAVVLVVCVELCSLHWRSERSVANQVASILFGDGAAAAIIAGDGAESAASAIGRIWPGRSLLAGDDAHGELMSWRITDAGFAMTLSPQVPDVLGAVVGDYLRDAQRTGLLPAGDGFLALHPGGPNVLDAVDLALELRGRRGLDAAWAVLGKYGNMSSATVLFVLKEALQRGYELPAALVAFGPGLSMESVGVSEPPKRRPSCSR